MKSSRLIPSVIAVIVLSLLIIAVPAVPCAAAGNISLDLYAAAVGANVTVYGNGFTSAVTFTKITLASGTIIASPTLIQLTNTGGSFTARFTVPILPKKVIP